MNSKSIQLEQMPLKNVNVNADYEIATTLDFNVKPVREVHASPVVADKVARKMSHQGNRSSNNISQVYNTQTEMTMPIFMKNQHKSQIELRRA
jgi:hypothetical protein